MSHFLCVIEYKMMMVKGIHVIQVQRMYNGTWPFFFLRNLYRFFVGEDLTITFLCHGKWLKMKPHHTYGHKWKFTKKFLENNLEKVNFFNIICVIHQYLGHFTQTLHFGFEATTWYHHFGDLVWLFLFVSIYQWGDN